jgi:hypothetical protein
VLATIGLPPGARRSSVTRGRTSSSEMKETSITARSHGSGTFSSSIDRTFSRSSTTTRGSCRIDHASCP